MTFRHSTDLYVYTYIPFISNGNSTLTPIGYSTIMIKRLECVAPHQSMQSNCLLLLLLSFEAAFLLYLCSVSREMRERRMRTCLNTLQILHYVYFIRFCQYWGRCRKVRGVLMTIFGFSVRRRLYCPKSVHNQFEHSKSAARLLYGPD